MRLCAITDRRAPAGLEAAGEKYGSDAEARRRLKEHAAAWSAGGVDYIQLREKDLTAEELRALAEEVFPRERLAPGAKLLLNFASAGGWELLAAVADGIHLPSWSNLAGRPRRGAAEEVRRIFHAHGREAIVSMSCHSLEEIRAARSEGTDFVLFAPVFAKVARERVVGKSGPKPGGNVDDAPGETSTGTSKKKLGEDSGGIPGQGLDALRRACEEAGAMPVFALGGITVDNAGACAEAGAAGVAGIRLFAGEDWRRLKGAARLRGVGAR